MKVNYLRMALLRVVALSLTDTIQVQTSWQARWTETELLVSAPRNTIVCLSVAQFVDDNVNVSIVLSFI
jgi:hypothetical protein